MSRQTLSYLIRRLEEVGIRPKPHHGQNFLIDLNLLEMIASSAKLEPNDLVLEVGTGTGSLTARIAPQVAEVITVEVDPQMHQLASEELIDFTNVTQLRLDALAGKHRLEPELVALVERKLAVDPERRLKLVSNLPYHIATPLISNLLLSPIVPVSMTVTIQKEMAERICARPATKDYSALSVWIQSQCATEIVRVMAPTVFWPRPKVDSAIVRIVLEPERRALIPDLEFFHTFVRTLFLHRRKFLRGVLIANYKEWFSKPQIDALLAGLGYVETVRAEELPPEEILRLAEAVRAM